MIMTANTHKNTSKTTTTMIDNDDGGGGGVDPTIIITQWRFVVITVLVILSLSSPFRVVNDISESMMKSLSRRRNNNNDVMLDNTNSGVRRWRPVVSDDKSKQEQKTIATTTIGRPIPPAATATVYACGYWWAILLAKNLFPENKYHHEVLTRTSNPKITTNDILVFGMFGPCEISQVETQSLNMKAKLYANGEEYDMDTDTNATSNNVYKLGPYEDTNTTIGGIFGAFNLFGYPGQTEIIKNMLYRYNELRDDNTGEYFLLYPNSNCQQHREQAIVNLSSIGIIHAPFNCDGSTASISTDYSDGDSGNKNKNNNIIRINVTKEQQEHEQQQQEHHRDFVQYLGTKYRFYFCMENTNKYGYLTEKIINAFFSGAIPIYYGTKKRDVYEVFNDKAFIYYDVGNPNIAIEQVRYLESNITAYKDMQKQPIFKYGYDINKTINTVIKNYFSYNDQFANGYMKHRIRDMMGI